MGKLLQHCQHKAAPVMDEALHAGAGMPTLTAGNEMVPASLPMMHMPAQSFLHTKTGTPWVQCEEDASAATAPVATSTEPDYLGLRKPFLNRAVPHLYDAGSALGVWQYNLHFFRNLGLSDALSGKAANFTAPLFIDAQLKAANPTWWEITDRQLQTSSFMAAAPLFNFDANFRNWQILPFLSQ